MGKGQHTTTERSQENKVDFPGTPHLVLTVVRRMTFPSLNTILTKRVATKEKKEKEQEKTWRRSEGWVMTKWVHGRSRCLRIT